MPAESAQWATQLDPTLPQATEPRSEGWEHLARIKEVLKQELALDSREWIYTGDAVTYVSGTVFTVASDVTDTYSEGRRIKVEGAATGTIYGAVVTATYSAATAVTLLFDTGSMQNETLTPYVSFYTQANTSIPEVGGNINYDANAVTKIRTVNGPNITAAAGLVTDSVLTGWELSPSSTYILEGMIRTDPIGIGATFSVTSNASLTNSAITYRAARKEGISHGKTAAIGSLLSASGSLVVLAGFVITDGAGSGTLSLQASTFSISTNINQGSWMRLTKG